MVSFAGSIGIIGIALILSLSNGVNNYIERIQEQTLSSYPFTIEEATADITGAITTIMGNNEKSDKKTGVEEIQVATEMFTKVGTNDLKSFKNYLDNNKSNVEKMTNDIVYSYGIDPQIYSSDTKDGVTILNPSDMFSTFTNSINSSMISTSFFNQMINNKDLLSSQYDMVAGSWPKNYNEVILVLSDAHSISDVLVYVLGLRDQSEFNKMLEDVMSGKSITNKNVPLEWTYDELLNITFKLVLSTDYYKYDDKFDIWTNMSDDEEYLKKLVENGIDIKISGIIAPKSGSLASLTPGISYTSDLIDYIINTSSESQIVKQQLKDTNIDVFSGKTFESIKKGNDSTGLDFQDMISIDSDALESAFGSNVSESDIKKIISSSIEDMTNDISVDTTESSTDFENGLKNLFIGLIKDNIDVTSYATFTSSNYENKINDYFDSDESKSIINSLENKYGLPSSNFAGVYSNLIKEITLSLINTMGGNATLNESTANTIIEGSLSTLDVMNVTNQLSKIMSETKMKISVASIATNMSTSLINKISSSIKVDPDKIASAFSFDFDEDELTRIITTLLTSSDEEVNATNNLRTLGYSEYDNPMRISVYFDSFDSKELFKNFITDYNETMTSKGEEDKSINYTDVTGILMSSVSYIVDIISYVLIAFVSVSLIVSSIMIGIITYISVLERTKEIGILRSIGASKRDIRIVFNAEAIIIGFCAGLFGIILTYILNIFVNIILESLTSEPSLAELPILAALILIAISVALTYIAGLIPSGIASKKDPVEALRSE